MGIDDYMNPEGQRLQVTLTNSDSDGLIINPEEDLKWARHPVRITEGAEKITNKIPDHRVLVELTGFSEARLISTFSINKEL